MGCCANSAILNRCERQALAFERAVLERMVMRRAIPSPRPFLVKEIEAKVRVYAPNPSFQEARDKLENRRMLVNHFWSSRCRQDDAR